MAQFQDSYDAGGSYQGTTVTYLHSDHLGTPRVGTDATQQISWRNKTDAFGAAGGITGPAVVRLRQPGQVDLGLGGVSYNYYRDYLPGWGRYLESDPIGLDGGLNTYSYAGANPLLYADPLGLWTWPSPMDVARYWHEVLGGGRDFFDNYRDLRAANRQMLQAGQSPAGADKYFHCMANCEAARRGPAGEDTSCTISDTREWADQTFKGYPASDSAADQLANRFGRGGGAVDREKSCKQVCGGFRPVALPAGF